MERYGRRTVFDATAADGLHRARAAPAHRRHSRRRIPRRKAFWTMTARTATRAAADQRCASASGRRHRDRSHRLVQTRSRPPSMCRPFEGSTKVACFCAIRSPFFDAVTSDVKAPLQSGDRSRPVKVHRAEGLDLATRSFPPPPGGAVCPDQPRDRARWIYKRAGAGSALMTLVAGSSASLSNSAPTPASARRRLLSFPRGQRGSYGGRPRSMAPTASTV